MFDRDLVRYLCGRLAEERDPQRNWYPLNAVVSSNTEGIRLRMSYLLRHYPEVLQVSNSRAA
jgi:hypothetical protein